MRGWLNTCNRTHDFYHCNKRFTSILPTRVIDVGQRPLSDEVSLYCSRPDEIGTYVTLSHCWGKNLSASPGQIISTLKKNINDHIRGINIRRLPKTFRDAIQVTRELGQRYLWIDSLCIIQDDPNDWRKEGSKMHTVYTLAYFTIAATSARNFTEGFLNLRHQREFVKIEKIQRPSSPPPVRSMEQKLVDLTHARRRYRKAKMYRDEGYGILRERNPYRPPEKFEVWPLYICEYIDDFDADVEESILGTRGWVLQERALSRRILHFSANQTYWDCGIGVHCESLTLMYKYVPFETNG